MKSFRRTIQRSLAAAVALTCGLGVAVGSVSASSPAVRVGTLTGASATSSSVVATAKVTYTGAPGPITLDWGDGTNSIQDPSTPGVTSTPGVVTFIHEFVGRITPFSSDARAIAGAQVIAFVIQVSPMYRVSQSNVTFRSISHCDEPNDPTTEWSFEQTVSGPFDRDVVERWTPTLTTAGPAAIRYYTLPGSSVVSESVNRYPGIRGVKYRWREIDSPFLPVVTFSGSFSLDPMLGNRRVVLTSPAPCVTELSFNITSELIRPNAFSTPPIVVVGP
jgi:hypothetical protein